MISDEQRREVARKLREPKESLLAYPDDELIRLRRETGCPRGQDFYEHLADLIDRPTCFDTESKDSKSFTCSACGFSESKLAVNPFTLSFLWVKPSYRYCPKCGAEVIE